jgi:lysophospholipase L1-like esterase
MKNLVKYILFFLLIILFFLGIDRVAGFFISANPDLKVYNRGLIIREHEKNLNKKYYLPTEYLKNSFNLENKEYTLITDEDGFIISNEEIKKYDTKIIFFGGSIVEGYASESNFRFPYLVSKNFNNENIKVKTLNAGVFANNTFHDLTILLSKGIPQKPNYAILLNGFNDFSQSTKGLYYWSKVNTGRKNFLYESDFSVNFYNILENNFKNLWLLLKINFSGIKLVKDRMYDEFFLQRKTATDVLHIESIFLKDYQAMLRSFIDICKNNNIEPILMTHPNLLKKNNKRGMKSYSIYQNQLSFEETVKIYALFNNEIIKISKEKNVTFIDLDKELNGNEKYFIDLTHLSKEGNIKVASIISQTLKMNYPNEFKSIK